MKVLLLLLALAPQNLPPNLDWKLINEMSGPIPNHKGLTISVYGAKIARGNDLVKLWMRADFPGGAPTDIMKGSVPHGFDVSSVASVVVRVQLNCKTFTVKPENKSVTVYQFNGKKHKSKEPPFKIESGHVFAQYFCEQGNTPTSAPTLKPK